MEATATTKKTADRTAYMREYKQKKYAENPNIIKEKNKAYYYKYKCGLTAEEMAKYDTLTPYVARIKIEIDKFKEKDLTKSVLFLEELLAELKNEEMASL